MKTLRFILPLLFALGLAACHSSHKSVSPTDNDKKWHTLELPVKLRLESPAEISLSGKAMFVNDSLIYVSLRMLGMEVAYAYADADSAILCDRFHKIYLSEPVSRFIPARMATIKCLQDIMAGQNIPAQLKDHIRTSGQTDTPAGIRYSNINVTTDINQKKFSATLEYNYDKAKWDDSGFSIPKVRLPKNARKADPQALLKELRQL